MDSDSQKTNPVPKPNEWEQRFVEKRHGKEKRATEDIFWQDIQNISSNVLQKSNKNGNASKVDLAKSITSGALKGDEALVGAALYDNFSNLKGSGILNLSAPVINKESIASFTSKAPKAERWFRQVDDLTFWADDSGNLKKYSPHNSGFLNKGDISSALSQANTSADDKAMLSELMANFNSIAKNNLIGIKEIDAYYKTAKNDPEVDLLRTIESDMKLVEVSQSNPAAHKLYANDANPLKSINAQAVRQGYSGDCGFKAALAALAQARPQDIAKLIKANSSSGFDVQLPGVKNKSFAVSKPTDEELGLYSHAQNPDGFWPQVLAKAYGQNTFNTGGLSDKQRMIDKTEDEQAGYDGAEAHAIQALTNHQVFQTDLSRLSDTDLLQNLLAAQRDKRIMVLGNGPGEHKTPDGFKRKHAFTITNVNNDGGNLKVTVRDPEDSGPNRPDGTIQVSMQTLRKNFDSIFIETNKNL